MKPAGLQSKNPVSPSPWKLRELGNLGHLGHLAMACLVAVLAWAGCQAQVTKVPPGGEQDLSLPGGATNCQGIKCLSTTMVCCPGEDCVDTTNNPNHCGACGKSCNSGEICDNSRCVCSVGNMVCNNGTSCCPGSGGCVNLGMDPRNCGTCGKVCSNNETCKNGGCVCGNTGIVCPVNQTCCGAGCVDMQTDSNNCGTCGKKCKESCKNGSCTEECNPMCAVGETCCSSKCVNLRAIPGDPMNCGTCGKVCKPFLGFPPSCNLGICSGEGQDGGMNADMSVPKDM